MKRAIATVAPAIVAGLVIASPAAAQLDLGAGAEGGAGITAGENGVGAGMSAGGSAGAESPAGAAGVDSSTTSATSATAQVPDVNEAIASLADTTATIGSSESIQAVRVLPVAAAGEGAAQAVAQADETQIQALRDTITANKPLKGALDTNGIETSAIVAADFDSQGNLVLFTQ